jgi:hypothetical protein
LKPPRLPWQRLLPALAATTYVAAVLIWVGGDRRSQRDAFPAGSVWNTGEGGLSLAFAYLGARTGGPGRRDGAAVLRRAIGGADLPADAVVLRIAPDPALAPPRAGQPSGDQPSGNSASGDSASGQGGAPGKAPSGGPLLTAAEERWIEGGGRLVLAFGGGYGPLAAATVAHPHPLVPLRKAFPVWPGVARLLPHPRRTLAGSPLATAQTLWLDGDAPVAARLSLGAGDVVLLACPEIFFNGRLGEGDHLALLDALTAGSGGVPRTPAHIAGTNALAGAGSGSGPGSNGANGADGGNGVGGKGSGTDTGGARRAVFFDERAHGAGEEGGAVEILAAWGFAPLLVLGAVAAGVAFWRGAVRLGPADRDDSDDRSEAVELVDSLADLYDRALGRADAIRLYHDSFVLTVAANTGLRGGALAARAGELAAGFSAADLPAPPAPAGGPPAGAAGQRLPADISRAAFDRALQLLNQAFRRLDDAKRG